MVAVTTNVWLDDPEVGVPEIAHVVVLKLRPAGSDALMAQDEMAPPEFAGVAVEINWPTTKLNGEPENEILGAGGNTSRLNWNESLPEAFVAVTVNELALATVVGVPEMLQLAAFKLKPAGSDGITLQEAIAPP